ncbi:major capsid protein [Citromicrobium phage vB_Cib_ssDNA_P1]|nr:major capsid protein [Citromicrobium phage vB_Cib_ssDNA_P1]
MENIMRTLMSAPPTGRVGRYPKHPFLTQEKPFTAQPFFLARVLPGETLQNLRLESRVITDPIKNSIIGWSKEYYVFYVKVSDLMIDAIKDMFIDPTNAEITGQDAATNVQRTYTPQGGIDWTGMCLTRIVETYFRDEGETAASHALADGTPMVQIRQNSFLDSITDKDEIPEGAAISTATDAGDLDRLMDAFEMARSLGMANMSYEDFLRGYGINIPDKDEDKPELIDRWKDWQYPSNTINPATGAPSSACSWVFKNGSRDPKFFKEPGFLVGISVTRPKVYMGNLSGSAASFAKRAWDWMPNYLMAYPEAALKQFGVDAGPLGVRTTDTDSYWIDMRDELLYGDQFQNMHAFDAAGATANTDGSNNLFGLPLTDFTWKYPTEAMINSLFVQDDGSGRIRQDGYVGLSIKGAQGASPVDYTMGNIAET